MAQQIKGKCRCCSKEFTRAGMLRHLVSCKSRESELLLSEKGKTTGYFELLIADKYKSEYWLIIEIEDSLKLLDLDRFIRDIWVECCGHLSTFYIAGQYYDVQPDKDSIWGPPAKSMNIQLKKVISVGMSFGYEYDFGSTTELIITVKSHREGKKRGQRLTILSRNNPPEIICGICNEKHAKWVNTMAYYDDDKTLYLCEECLRKSREELDEDIDDEEVYYDDYYLPVCNSPRMGVCGYMGTESDM